MTLYSPTTGGALHLDGYALLCGTERWPVLDGIAFLRADRRELANAALAYLDAGDAESALLVLLADQDDWASTPPPPESSLRRLVRERNNLSYRQAMELLQFGPVATYFTHRWSDPTFMSGLALAQAYWSSPSCVVEIACGTGHFLRAFSRHTSRIVGGDVVFAKLWLARHYVAPEAELVCYDASGRWPLEGGSAHLLFCHDAFYFLPDKPAVAAEMIRVSPRILVGHAHNALADNYSSGEPLSPNDYAVLFPGCTLFDDAELTSALVEQRQPRAAPGNDLVNVAAVSMAYGFTRQPSCAAGPITQPEPGASLQRNPLYENGQIRWPSDRYAREYDGLVTYPLESDAPMTAIAGMSDDVDRLARTRVMLELPERW